jgi:large subunit ribosomal protein L9
MKIVLLNDVSGVGQRFEVKDVSEGYAQNFLFPKRLAEPATAAALSRVEKMKKEREEKQKMNEAAIAESLKKIKSLVVKIKEKANEAGHLFSGLTAEKIASLLQKEGIELPANAIQLKEPIKAVGDHEIKVEISGKKAAFKLVVEKN